MSDTIPEDLSELPDFDTQGVAPQPPATDGRVPEDLADLPDAEVRPEEPLAPAPTPSMPARGRRVRRSVAALIVAAVAGLAIVFGITEVKAFVSASFAVHPVLGCVGAALVVLLFGLLGVVVTREVRGYMRLRSFESLRDSFRQLATEPRSPQAHRRVWRETEEFLDYLNSHPDPELALAVERLRGRLYVGGNAQEWQDDIERVLLHPLDAQVLDAVRREAVNVGIGTAISPWGFLDAAITLWRNLRLIRKIASIYRVRAGAYGTYLILRRTIAAAALADLAQEASVAFLGTTRSLTAVIGAPLAQGLANAGLTVRIGLKAQEQCRPLLLPSDRKTSIMRMLLGSVTGTVRSLARGRQKTEKSGELEAPRPDQPEARPGFDVSAPPE